MFQILGYDGDVDRNEEWFPVFPDCEHRLGNTDFGVFSALSWDMNCAKRNYE